MRNVTPPTPSRQPDHGSLVVHLRRGTTEIPLTGDPKLDALLRRWAGKDGSLVLERRAA